MRKVVLFPIIFGLVISAFLFFSFKNSKKSLNRGIKTEKISKVKAAEKEKISSLRTEKGAKDTLRFSSMDSKPLIRRRLSETKRINRGASKEHKPLPMSYYLWLQAYKSRLDLYKVPPSRRTAYLREKGLSYKIKEKFFEERLKEQAIAYHRQRFVQAYKRLMMERRFRRMMEHLRSLPREKHFSP